MNNMQMDIVFVCVCNKVSKFGLIIFRYDVYFL